MFSLDSLRFILVPLKFKDNHWYKLYKCRWNRYKHLNSQQCQHPVSLHYQKQYSRSPDISMPWYDCVSNSIYPFEFEFILKSKYLSIQLCHFEMGMIPKYCTIRPTTAAKHRILSAILWVIMHLFCGCPIKCNRKVTILPALCTRISITLLIAKVSELQIKAVCIW